MFKTREGGGGQGPFKQCLKKLHNWHVMASLRYSPCFAVALLKRPVTGWHRQAPWQKQKQQQATTSHRWAEPTQASNSLS